MSSDDHDNYRPRSPKLPSFPAHRPPNRLPSFHENSGYPAGYSLNHRGSYDASPFFSPSSTQVSTSYFGTQPHAVPNQEPFRQNFSLQNFQSELQYPSQPQAQYQSQFQSKSHFQSPVSFAHPQNLYPIQTQPTQSTNNDMARSRRRKASSEEDDGAEDVYTPDSTVAASRSNKKRKSNDPALPPDTKVGPGPSQGIEVRTKFPVARIKRIMQADEDVGKVAQATPTAVSKALELFIISLVTKGAAEARTKNSKRVTAAHLKAALMKDSQFDFLNEICASVPDALEKKGARAKSFEDSEDESKILKGGKGKSARRKSEKIAEDSD